MDIVRFHGRWPEIVLRNDLGILRDIQRRENQAWDHWITRSRNDSQRTPQRMVYRSQTKGSAMAQDMESLAGLIGTFVSMKTMADGTVRATFDMDCTLSAFAKMNPSPGMPFAVAPMVIGGDKTTQATEVVGEGEKEPIGPLCKWAAMRCKEPEFWKFMGNCQSELEAKMVVMRVCGCEKSRKELDENSVAARIFREKVMIPWQNSPDNPYRSEE